MFDKIISSKLRTILLFLILGFLCYGWILNSPFKLLDDYACIVENTTIHSLSNWARLFTDSFFGDDGSYYRPLVALSFMLEYHAFKLQHIFYNLDNILLHISCAILVWMILTRLLKDRAWAFYTALLFLIHPVNWEQITNIPGRSILMCAFFVLTALYLLLRSLERQSFLSMMMYYAGSLMMFTGGLLSKESAVVFPVVVMLLMVLMVQADIRKKIARTIPYFLILAGYVWLREHLGITKLTQIPSTGDVVLAVVTFLKSLGIHMATLLFPMNLVYDRSLAVFKDFYDLGFWMTIGIGGAVAGTLFYFRRAVSASGWFGLAWIFLNFLPVSQLVPIYVSDQRISIADHFLYLPSIACFVFLIYVTRMIFRYPAVEAVLSYKVQRILLLICLGYFVFSTAIQAMVSTNQFVMFESALESSPKNNRVRTALASAYGYAGMPEKAEKQSREVLRYSPWDSKARIGLAKALCDQNRCWEAVTEYHKVFNPSPKDADLLEDNLRKTYPIVIRDYEVKSRRDPDNAEVHNVLGTVYLKTGRTKEGLEHLQKAVELKPDYAEAIFMMAYASEREGNWDDAAKYYKKFLEVVSPDEHFGRWLACERLAGFYRRQRQFGEAKHFKEMAWKEHQILEGR